MAPETDVKKYVACWMQLGTQVWFHNGQPAQVAKVIQGGRYSPEFENLWSNICGQATGDAYLSGTAITLQELMGNHWEIVQCARCTMPVAMQTAGTQQSLGCPCQELDNWPNTDLPCPRPPVDDLAKLKGIQSRLVQNSESALL
jgi:hypothetical protein